MPVFVEISHWPPGHDPAEFTGLRKIGSQRAKNDRSRIRTVAMTQCFDRVSILCEKVSIDVCRRYKSLGLGVLISRDGQKVVVVVDEWFPAEVILGVCPFSLT